MNVLPSRWPGVVQSYDAATRTCRVQIPGITDGASEMPIAQIEQAIGDASEHTEIRILAGDRVWLAFEGGDARFPIITGWRAKNTGNEVGTRRWHHTNFQTQFDQVHDVVGPGAQMIMDAPAGSAELTTAQTITLTAGTSITLSAAGSTIVIDSSGITITGPALTVNAPGSTFSGTVTAAGAVASAVSAGAPLLAATSSLTVSGVEMSQHTHGGITGGIDFTGPPA